ncbi:hypothetical protein [Nitrososphaera sp. AFS]|uniref:hypothetical protein n=1 Tax=Nitrososphaera sp. AFS TaxID=2301191 RepID=UPI0013922D46|nr:hypothetical protein [Nitrososphaera sp. AFS]
MVGPELVALLRTKLVALLRTKLVALVGPELVALSELVLTADTICGGLGMIRIREDNT